MLSKAQHSDNLIVVVLNPDEYYNLLWCFKKTESPGSTPEQSQMGISEV